jgi:hypothetical protein
VCEYVRESAGRAEGESARARVCGREFTRERERARAKKLQFERVCARERECARVRESVRERERERESA